MTLSTSYIIAQKSPDLPISGQVRGMGGEVIEGASIILKNVITQTTASSVLSGEKGYFRLTAGKGGRYRLLISSAGYVSFFSDTITLVKDIDLGIVPMQRYSKVLDEVVVKSSKDLSFIKADSRKLVYTTDKTVDAQGANALDLLRKIPGITIDQHNVITIKGGKGVLITINGRPTYLQAEDIGLFLKSLPSGSVKSIEVINNPSSEYDAAGSGGVINIVLQKSLREGLNGSVNLGAAYGISFKSNSDLSLNYHHGKLTVFGNYSNIIGHFAMDYSNDRSQGGTSYINPIHDVDKRNTASAALGSDYEIDGKQTIGILLNGNFVYGPGLISPDTYVYDSATNQLLRKLISSSSYYKQNDNRYDVNVNYRYEDTLGKLLSFDADYGYVDEGTKNLNSNTWFAPDGSFQARDIYRSINSKGIDMYAFSGNFQNKLWNGKIKLGAKFSRVSADNNFDLYSVVNDIDVIDTGNSNFYKYTEQIAAVYAKYEGLLFKNMHYDLGLRMENTHSVGVLTPVQGSSQQPSGTDRNYTDLFPTASLTYAAGKTSAFSLSYAQRIDRPAYKDLNPFEYPIDELSYWKGNPFLRPQYAQTLSLQFSHGKTIVQLEYTSIRQLNVQVTEVFDQDKIAMVPENAGYQHNVSLQVIRQLSPLKGWDMSFSAIANYLQNSVTIGQYGYYNPRRVAGMLTTQQRVTLPWGMIAELNGIFTSRTLSGPIGVSRGNSQVDLGLQKNVLKDKAVLRLAWTDIYQGNKSNTVSSYRGLYTHETFSGEYRQLKVNVTYKFGRPTNKPQKEHDSGLKSENGRL